jgi:hypothetical protein
MGPAGVVLVGPLELPPLAALFVVGPRTVDDRSMPQPLAASDTGPRSARVQMSFFMITNPL